MSQRRSALPEAKQHVVLQRERKGETARRVFGYHIQRDSAEKPFPQTKDLFADQTSQQARTMRAEIERVARRPFNILITGETGTGKTYAAREIHRLSARANNPFLELNCANLPEHLVEAELFGYRKGAFTGADRDHKGLFEEADGGVLFLDEAYLIEEDAAALLCQFDYPGNIRALRNLIYELTRYVEESEPISIELVQFVLAKLNLRGGNPVMSRNDTTRTSSSLPSNEITSTANATNIDITAHHSLLRSIAHEGDIILPLELCVLRSGETFRQWTARAKRCSIEAARQATGGTMQSAAERLGLSRNSLLGHLHRARQTQNEALFDLQQDLNRDS